MTLTQQFWNSFVETDNPLDEHFSEFASECDLSEEEVDAIRTDVVITLIEYFAQIVEDIHRADRAEGTPESPISKIWDYFADDCFQLEESTKELLSRSIAASAVEFADDDDDDDDDEYQVKKFLKAIVDVTPHPDKDYIDAVRSGTIGPGPYGNEYSGGVKVFNRRAHRYGHGPNEGTDVVIRPTLKSQDLTNDPDDSSLRGNTAAAKSLWPNSKPGYSTGLSVAHHAVPDLTKYCNDNDIECSHLGMGPGVQHLGFENEPDRNKAARFLKQQFGMTSFKPFVRQNNESATLQPATDLEESITHGVDKYGELSNHDQLMEAAIKHMRRTSRPTPYNTTAMASVRAQLQAAAKINQENPLFENDTARDPRFLAKLDGAKSS